MSIFKTYGNEAGTRPTFTIAAPQTGFVFDVRALTVKEVHSMKETMTSNSRAVTIIHDIIWGAIVRKPDGIKTFEDFLLNTTLKDREAIAYGIYVMTFGKEKLFEVYCLNCQKTQKIKINFKDIYSAELYPKASTVINSYRVVKASKEIELDPEIEKAILEQENSVAAPPEGMPEDIAREQFKEYYEKLDAEKEMTFKMKKRGRKTIEKDIKPIQEITPSVEEKPVVTNIIDYHFENETEDILHREIKVQLPISGIYAIIHQPTLEIEANVIKSAPYIESEQIDLANDTFIIKRFDEYEGDVLVNSITDRVTIIEGYQELPAGDKKIMYETYNTEFGKYAMNLKSHWKCGGCDFKNPIRLDTITLFFRMVNEF